MASAPVHRDLLRLDESFGSSGGVGAPPLGAIEIPEHLLYHPPQVADVYTNVEPRYLNPKSKRDPPRLDLLLPKAHIPRNPQFRNVSPRIYEQRKPSPGPAPIPRFDPKTLEQHAAIAKRQWGAAQPRYLDSKPHHPEGQPSPRDMVEAQRQANKRITSWRDVCTTPVAMTFDEYRQRNRRLLAQQGARDHLNVKPRPAAHSPVREYIRTNVPIPHHTTGPHYVSPAPQRDLSPQHWTPGGGVGGGKWAKKGAPLNGSIRREQQYIRAWREHALEKRVTRSHVPRVASLSPSAAYRRWASESSASRTCASVAETASLSPSREVTPQRGRAHTPQPQPRPQRASPHRARTPPQPLQAAAAALC